MAAIEIKSEVTESYFSVEQWYGQTGEWFQVGDYSPADLQDAVDHAKDIVRNSGGRARVVKYRATEYSEVLDY